MDISIILEAHETKKLWMVSITDFYWIKKKRASWKQKLRRNKKRRRQIWMKKVYFIEYIGPKSLYHMFANQFYAPQEHKRRNYVIKCNIIGNGKRSYKTCV